MGIEDILQYIGQNLSFFYSEFVCGGILLSKSNSNNEIDNIEAPLAFQSTLAGILLASELVMYRTGIRTIEFKNYTQIYPLLPFKRDKNPYNHTSGKDKTGICICNDEDFRKEYAKKFSL